jgi:hypothetical protein
MREDVDAHPERLDLGDGLVHAAVNAQPVQVQGEYQATDTGSDNGDVHG